MLSIPVVRERSRFHSVTIAPRLRVRHKRNECAFARPIGMSQLTLATVGNRRPDCMFTFAIAIRAPRLAIDIGMESPLVQVGRSALPSDDSITTRIEAAFVARIGMGRFSLWFPPNARLLWFGHELVVASRNSHFQEWADDKFGPALREAVAEVCGEGVGTRFVSDPDLFADAKPAKAAEPAGQLNLLGEPCPPPTPQAAKKIAKAKAEAIPKTGRRWKTFDEFVVGQSNRVACAAAISVSEEPGLGPNPLVIHGPVGTGKTHLLESIYAAMRKAGGESRPLYVTAEDFANRFIPAARLGKMGAFRRQFRECSALLLDDLNFLATKRATQEEFLHTLDALIADGRQVVVTVDCHPRLADDLMPELRDRLLGGVAWGLLPPDDETRLGILRRKSLGTIPDEVLKYLARNLRGNVRELEGAVHCVRHFAKVTEQPMTNLLAREALGDLLRHTVRAITVSDVDLAVCALLRIPAGTLQSKSRSWAVSHPRMLAITLARKLTAATYGEIAKHFGVRQHSTAVAAEKKVRKWIADSTILVLGERKWGVKDLLDSVERDLNK